MAFDAATGKKLWETPTTAAFHHQQAGNGPRGTPTIDSGRVYAEAADGMLVCLAAAIADKSQTITLKRLEEYVLPASQRERIATEAIE